eukprot:1798582-Pleurochrysis_carterae.AAC.1
MIRLYGDIRRNRLLLCTIHARPRVENKPFCSMVDHPAEWIGDFPICETTMMGVTHSAEPLICRLSFPNLENQPLYRMDVLFCRMSNAILQNGSCSRGT